MKILKAWESFQKFRESLIYPRYEGCRECNFFFNCFGGCPIEPNLVFCEDKGGELNLHRKVEESKI